MNTPIPLKCPRCGHTWLYRGESQYRATCYGCGTTVLIRKCKISIGQYVESISGEEEK